MMFLGILIGTLIGFFIGFIIACAGYVAIERNAIDEGFIKLNGRFYSIKEIEKGGKK